MQSVAAVLIAFCALTGFADAAKGLARTPPMGWMSWQYFRCDINCPANETSRCITEDLYKTQTDSMVSSGLLKAGYDTIHIDDCWERKDPPRDPLTQQLVPNPDRFPSGMKALADYMHDKNVKFGTYTAEDKTTCGGFPASAGYETLDAMTFAGWGVDYLKVDGCGSKDYYPTGYPAMGKALNNSGRDIVYSCSWPAYLGDDETTKPFTTMIDIGCNLWRNWHDIQCSWSSLVSIIGHWGQYGEYMSKYAAPGHWNDPDMLLIGNDCITEDEAETQMAIWSISAAPLILGNDMTNMTSSGLKTLLNEEAIAVDQDAMGQQGIRLTPLGPSEIWARNLSDGSVAVGLFNRNATSTKMPSCDAWSVELTDASTHHPTHGLGECYDDLTLEQVKQKCCEDHLCHSILQMHDGSMCFLKSQQQPFAPGRVHRRVGYVDPAPSDITLNFSMVGFSDSDQVQVRDISAQKDAGTFQKQYTASVNVHGTAFLRLSKK